MVKALSAVLLAISNEIEIYSHPYRVRTFHETGVVCRSATSMVAISILLDGLRSVNQSHNACESSVPVAGLFWECQHHTV